MGSMSLDCINAAAFAASAQLRAVTPQQMPSAADLLRPLMNTIQQQVPQPSTATPTEQQQAAAATAEEPVKPLPTLEELEAQLDELVGLTAVKDEVKHETELLRVDKLRTAQGLKSPEISKHLVFSGNPGTGKTTVARLVAGIYRAVGVLPKGQLIETDRSGLVAGYVGQTALKTADVIKSALGGVLFIDEAYALATDDFGNEAIDTIVKAMEDHRDELVVIVAGYTEEMAIFISSNPGLESRFRTTIEFPDYSDDELIQIFKSMCKDADFTPTDDCTGRLQLLLKGVTRGRTFGNARWVRNQFDAAVVRQAWRLRDIASPTVDQLRTLEADDLPALTPPETPTTDAGPAPATAS
jgi:SpoVK/Ycf46/Vps4 family AAA+-type ATPase